MNKLISFKLFVAFFIVTGIAYAGGGKNDPGSGRKKDPIGSNPSDNCKVATKMSKVIIYDSSFVMPTIRRPEYPVPLNIPSPWSGQIGAISLYDSPNQKYYCLVTVATQCVNWGDNGVKTYVWNTDWNEMDIEVPDGMMFRITVEYYEPCGAFWYGSPQYGRGKWYYEQEIGYSPVISFSTFLFVNKEIC